jgi:hypothetical protein
MRQPDGYLENLGSPNGAAGVAPRPGSGQARLLRRTAREPGPHDQIELGGRRGPERQKRASSHTMMS